MEVQLKLLISGDDLTSALFGPYLVLYYGEEHAAQQAELRESIRLMAAQDRGIRALAKAISPELVSAAV